MEEKVAAGGIVIQESDKGVLVLLVHRPKYDDWSFPKGKTKPGESLEHAALREVKEETGLDCRIIREISATHYQYRTRKGEMAPKVVHYFLMESAGGDISIDGDEVDIAKWFEVEEAQRRLAFKRDRDLLSSVAASVTVEI